MARLLSTWGVAALAASLLMLVMPAVASANTCTLAGTVVDVDLPNGNTTPVGTTTMTLTDVTNPAEGSVSTTFTGGSWSVTLPASLDTYTESFSNPYYETGAGGQVTCLSHPSWVMEPNLVTMTGYVTDAATGRPLPYVTVTPYRTDLTTVPFLSGYTDAAGHYEAQGYDDQPWLVEYTAANYQSTFYVLAGPTTTLATTHDLSLAPDASEIYGTVSDTSGPLSGIKVEAGNYSTTTNASGQYTISGVPAGSYTVEFIPPAGDRHVYQFYNGQPGGTASQALASVVTTTNGAGGIANATLAAGGTISGTVQDDAGAALSGATVTLEGVDGQTVGVPFGQSYQATTGSDGSYKLSGIPTGSYLVEAGAPDETHFAALYPGVLQAGTLGVSGAEQVTVTAPTSTQHIDITEPRSGTVYGTVSNAGTGDAVAAGTVGFYDAGGGLVASTTTGADGGYSLRLPDGTWFARFTPPQPDNSGDLTVWYGDAAAEASSQPVTVTPGGSLQVDQTLSAGGYVATSAMPVNGGATGTTPTVGTTTSPATTNGSGVSGAATAPSRTSSPAVTPAKKPKLSAVKLAGLAKRSPTLSFKLTDGAHKLKTFTVKLPAGLSFDAKRLKRTIALPRGMRFSYRLGKGALTITLAKGQSTAALNLKAGAIAVTARLAHEAKAKKVKPVTIDVTVVDATKLKTAISAKTTPS